MTAMKHGSDAEVTAVITGPECPRTEGVRFVEQKERLGSNAANRLGLKSCDDDAIIVLAADDVIFTKGWLGQVLPKFLAAEKENEGRAVLMGIRHIGGIGTTYGRMYANFPMFRKSMLATYPAAADNFCPEWLIGQWGDCAFGMGVWREDGVVLDSDTDPLIRWADRMGHPESPMKYAPMENDTEIFRRRFADFGSGWPMNFRGFNIDCSPAMLENGTICLPEYRDFVEKYNQCR